MKNKGFTLMEVVVTIGIVVLLGVAIASTCLVATKNASNTKNINFAINEAQNVQKLFYQSNLESSGNLNYDNLQNLIDDYYNQNVIFTKQNNNLSADVFYSDNFTINTNEHNCLQFNFNFENKIVTMSIKATRGEQVFYTNENIFFKKVNVWKIKEGLFLHTLL